MSSLGNKEIMAKNIQRYMDLKGKDRKDICTDLGFKYSTFSEWVSGNKYPRIDKIEIMANYFGISKADLVEAPALNQKSLPHLTPKDEDNIQKKLNSIIDDLSPDSGLAYFDGEEPLTNEDKELLRISLENSLRLAKQLAKQKFTPKKYRKE